MNDILVWTAREHEPSDRDRSWYVALAITAVSLALVSMLLNNFFFSILIVVAALTLALHAQGEPPFTEFKITRRGIGVGQHLHLYEECIAFWVEDQNVDPPLLLVDTTQWLSPNLVIPLVGIDPTTVRSVLAQKMEERPMKEPLAHKILESFGL